MVLPRAVTIDLFPCLADLFDVHDRRIPLGRYLDRLETGCPGGSRAPRLLQQGGTLVCVHLASSELSSLTLSAPLNPNFERNLPPVCSTAPIRKQSPLSAPAPRPERHGQ